MPWNDKIFRYCERGADPAFWAEPLNAATNAAFLIAAVYAGVLLVHRAGRNHAAWEWLLVAALFVIGLGSFLFHTFATRWAALADVGPIGVFMFAYLAYALARFLRVNWLLVAAGLATFAYAMHLADGISCRVTLISVVGAARGPCLNGTAAYTPAFTVMILIGAALILKRHPAGLSVLSAGSVFLVSMFFRTVDFEICNLVRFADRPLGTHFLWHVLNAASLYLLVRAAILYGRGTADDGRPGAALAGP